MIDKKPTIWEKIKRTLPYFLALLVTIGIVALGSIDKQQSGTTLSLDSFAKSDYDISVDQLSEMYVVADLSDALGLASASDVASNYVVTTSMYEVGQTATGKLEKPSITNINIRRGVDEYVVKPGDSAESIAAKYNITVDQLRWSNGMKDNSLTVGATLYIPNKPGIVYTVKAGDTVEAIAAKYGSTAEKIISMNDLDVSGVVEGAKILIENGTLPENERPEYVAPRRATTTYRTGTYRYSYLGNTSERQDVTVLGYVYGLGGPYGGGQCTQWAWSKRRDLPSTLGNANTWAARASAAGYVVNRTPSAGAIFQTSSGWYGHVGYVESVNGDGSIVVTEMNYNYRPYMVIRATIPASAVGNFNYIH